MTPASLLCQMTAIHKRGILVGSIYATKVSFEVRVPQPWNLSLTGFEPARVLELWKLPLTGFEPAFLKIPCVNNHLS